MRAGYDGILKETESEVNIVFGRGGGGVERAVNPQSTYIYIIKRVQQCMSPRQNWDSSTPSLDSECASFPPGSANSDDWRKV